MSELDQHKKRAEELSEEFRSEQIRYILALLRCFWKQNKELRLGQILSNLAADTAYQDVFFVPDSGLREQLESRIDDCGNEANVTLQTDEPHGPDIDEEEYEKSNYTEEEE